MIKTLVFVLAVIAIATCSMNVIPQHNHHGHGIRTRFIGKAQGHVYGDYGYNLGNRYGGLASRGYGRGHIGYVLYGNGGLGNRDYAYANLGFGVYGGFTLGYESYL
ncbi:hypothetical protein CEXT_235951 [Caerostris extrusa]|uniref:Uncharacterized protein n=1 Tax=Caerostris extrusa TaxID=172846 RepID=A0AAV4XPX0_CAEEX|nr:hypothetical protein CEXT_235951 [Caerostris extrusa]